MSSSNKDIYDSRPEGFLRIQRKDEFGEIYDQEKYKMSGQDEGEWLRRFGMKLFKKQGAETKELIAGHLDSINKGYTLGFKDYLTYNERAEEKFYERFKEERPKG